MEAVLQPLPVRSWRRRTTKMESNQQLLEGQQRSANESKPTIDPLALLFFRLLSINPAVPEYSIQIQSDTNRHVSAVVVWGAVARTRLRFGAISQRPGDATIGWI
jgi:hypothetical protein